MKYLILLITICAVYGLEKTGCSTCKDCESYNCFDDSNLTPYCSAEGTC